MADVSHLPRHQPPYGTLHSPDVSYVIDSEMAEPQPPPYRNTRYGTLFRAAEPPQTVSFLNPEQRGVGLHDQLQSSSLGSLDPFSSGRPHTLRQGISLEACIAACAITAICVSAFWVCIFTTP